MHFALEEESQIDPQVLREAAEVGIADIEAGHFQDFVTPESLRHHLSTLAKIFLVEEALDADNS